MTKWLYMMAGAAVAVMAMTDNHILFNWLGLFMIVFIAVVLEQYVFGKGNRHAQNAKKDA